MNAIERKLSNMLKDFEKKHNGATPKYVECVIRWNNGGEMLEPLQTNSVFALYPYNSETEKNDDAIFFYLDDPSYLYEMLANLDFLPSDFESVYDYAREVDKYDTQDIESEDWQYLHRGEDFCIVDIQDMYDEI